MDTWGTYERQSKNRRTGEETTDTVTLQADPVNRARYEAKGFTFKSYAPIPGAGVALGVCPEGLAASEQIFGFLPEKRDDLDQATVVKEAVEVALRKMTGSWTQAEAEAESAAHLRGQYKPPETPFAIVQGDPTEGFEKLVAEGDGVVNPNGPAGVAANPDGSGVDGSGTRAPRPNPTPETQPSA